VQQPFSPWEAVVSATNPTAESNHALLPSLSTGLGPLAAAIDDLHRAALILRQESRTTAARFRTPHDLRQIADQFSARARSCQAAHETILATCQEIASTKSP
jgi:hypothetical protein